LLRATMHQIPLYLNNGNYSYDWTSSVKLLHCQLTEANSRN
jgi:hypothetical protein